VRRRRRYEERRGGEGVNKIVSEVVMKRGEGGGVWGKREECGVHLTPITKLVSRLIFSLSGKV